jgi:MoxR-like ATPase
METDLIYTGDKDKQPKLGDLDEEGNPLYPYLPDPELVEVVNLAIKLNRPLLLKGEPGSGKTRLARAVAHELKLNYEPWHIQSTSRARDGRYSFDTIARLRDAQLAAYRALNNEEVEKTNDLKTYRRWGPLGQAFENSSPTVLLIDEIDKADIDFPNDLLLELEERRFRVEETDENVKAKSQVIVFITSNEEKDLPDAFLRRCLFYYIEFPSPKKLTEIIESRFAISPEEIVENVVTRVIEEFLKLRRQMEDEHAEKLVSTSELIDWFASLRGNKEALSKLGQGLLVHPGVLLKTRKDLRTYPKRIYDKVRHD